MLSGVVETTFKFGTANISVIFIMAKRKAGKIFPSSEKEIKVTNHRPYQEARCYQRLHQKDLPL